MIPFVDVVYDGDDYEFEISLEPKDPCCFGFKVVYHNGSFLLLQNIESIDISCVPGMEYIEHDEELYDREPFTVVPINKAAIFLFIVHPTPLHFLLCPYHTIEFCNVVGVYM